MRRNFLLPLFCCGLMMLGASSCSDDTNDGISKGDGDSSIVINSEDAQEELDRVGKELLQSVDLNKMKPVVELTDFCLQEFPEFKDGVYGVIDDVPIYFVMQQTRNVLNGDFTSITTKAFVRSLYHYTDIYGTYEWNGEQWTKRPNNENLEFLFSHNGKDCQLIIEKSGEDITIDDQTFSLNHILDGDKIVVPQKMTAKVYEDNQLLINVGINIDKFKSKDYQINTNLDVMNYYHASGSLISNSTTANITASLKSENKTLLAAQLQAEGKNLADYDIIGQGAEYCDINTISLNLNILNSVQLDAATNKWSTLIDSLDYAGDYYKCSVIKNGRDSVIYSSPLSKEEAKNNALKAALAVTNNMNTVLKFSNSQYSAPVKWDVYDDEYYDSTYDYYEGTYHEMAGKWELEPVIIFDNASYTLGNFFTETRFQSLIDAFKDLCEEANEIYN